VSESASGSRPGGVGLVRWASLAGLAVAVFLGVFSFDRGAPEAWSESVGLASLVAGPFGLALLATRLRGPGRREAVWLAAGVLALVIGVLSFSAVVVIAPPAVVILIGAVRELIAFGDRPRGTLVVLFAFVLLAGAGAGMALFLRTDPRCHAIGTTGVSCTSDAITWIETALSISVWAFAFAVITAALAGDRREQLGRRPEPIRPRTPAAGEGNGKSAAAKERGA